MIEKITGWLLELVISIFKAVWDFFGDIVISIFTGIFGALGALIKAIPAPAFLSQYSLTTLLGQMPGDVLYFVHALNLPACFALVGLGFAFRMLRKICTLGQW